MLLVCAPQMYVIGLSQVHGTNKYNSNNVSYKWYVQDRKIRYKLNYINLNLSSPCLYLALY